MATRRVRDPDAFAEAAAAACTRLLGRTATGVDWPASRSRRSVRVAFDDGSVVATRRRNRQRSRLEATVLETLHRHGAAVPAVLAYDGEWLIQEDLGGERLAALVVGAEDAGARALLERAVEALARVHAIGAETGLADRLVRLGTGRDWLAKLVGTPARIGAALDVPAPALDLDALVHRLRPGIPCLVKWDARPGNAVVRADGTVAWFDWEHCGARNALDDFAWLLADEYVPPLPGLDALALAAAPGGMPADDARDYFLTYAAFHAAVRLALVIHHKGEGGWWDEAVCLADDKIRVTAAGAQALTARGAEFAAGTRETAALTGWFEAVGKRLDA